MDPDPPSLKRPGDATLSPGPDVKRSKPDDSIDPEPVGDLPPDAAQGQKGKGRQGDKVKRDEKRAINAGGKHRGRRGTRQEGAAEEDDGQPKAPRLPKRQCALLIGFSGTGYAGMQMFVLLILGVFLRTHFMPYITPFPLAHVSPPTFLE